MNALLGTAESFGRGPSALLSRGTRSNVRVCVAGRSVSSAASPGVVGKIAVVTRNSASRPGCRTRTALTVLIGSCSSWASCFVAASVIALVGLLGFVHRVKLRAWAVRSQQAGRRIFRVLLQ